MQKKTPKPRRLRWGWGALLGGLVILVICGAAQAELPRNYKEFKDRYQREGTTPEGALKLYFEAVFCYIDEATRAEASKMLRYAMYLDMPVERAKRLFVERMEDPDYNYVFRSFVEGATPENDYRVSLNNFSLRIAKRTKDLDYIKLWLDSTGADSLRAVSMLEVDGLWYTYNNANTYLGVRKPQSMMGAKKHAHDADYDVPGSTAPSP